jgi:hypothetical protein
MHYFEDAQNRERMLVEDLARYHWMDIQRILGIEHEHRFVIHMDKRCYGAVGDVDIGIWVAPDTPDEQLIAIEVKTQFLCSDGLLRSQKREKHRKQLENLKRDGWDYVWLFDVIVTEPALDWWHPQAFDGFDQHARVVDDGYGHCRLQINAVHGRPESEAGSIGQERLKVPWRLPAVPARQKIVRAFRGRAMRDVFVCTSRSLVHIT